MAARKGSARRRGRDTDLTSGSGTAWSIRPAVPAHSRTESPEGSLNTPAGAPTGG